MIKIYQTIWYIDNQFIILSIRLKNMANVKVYKVDEIKAMLTSSDAALVKGLMRIYSHQTQDEQSSQDVKYHNGIGFRVCDARILTSLAEFYQKRNYLSDKQMVIVRKKMPVYARQLTNFANGKI